MVKIKSPLNSPSASGTVNNKVTYYNSMGKTYAKFKQRLPVSRSAAQEAINTLFKEATTYIPEITPEQKEVYAAINPNSASCPWYNNFISSYMKDPFAHGKSIIRSIEFVKVYIAPGYSYGFKYIEEVDRFKSALIHLGNIAVVNNPAQGVSCAELYSNEIVGVYVYASNPTDTIWVNCLVVGFNPTYVKSRQHCAVMLLDGFTNATLEIDEVNPDTTLLFPGGSLYSTSANVPSWFYGVRLMDSTHLRVDRNSGTGNLDVWTTVIDFY